MNLDLSDELFPLHATPITRPKVPADPACTPEMASSITTARVGSTEQLCRHQKRIRDGCSGQMLGMNHVAIDLYVEKIFQFGGL